LTSLAPFGEALFGWKFCRQEGFATPSIAQMPPGATGYDEKYPARFACAQGILGDDASIAVKTA
jgi:hypothetical protein